MRIAVPIRPVHQDTTLCSHHLAPSGKPKEPGCTGRNGYLARCTGLGCSWRRTSKVRAELETVASRHLDTHRPAPSA